ncbi:MAG: response regulator [Candidatus Acidiferrales bacterium]|jgi:CheY-like chemotaxis protein/anti-sigma regulatory factor (Ser/Thr protein kinase)
MLRARSSERILVADDDHATLVAVSGVLKEAGYTVTTAKDGDAACHALGKEHFDLAFLDIWMPGHTGLQVLEHVRKKRGDVKAVIMTVDETPQSVLQAIKDQALEYLNKPLTREQILQAAQWALDKEATLPIEVISARPTWVELEIPCTREAAERIQSFLLKLDSDLPVDLRNSVGVALRELLLNAVEWGGKLDPTRKVRIAHIRCARMLLYRIADPGSGFTFNNMAYASLSATKPEELTAVALEREKRGMRPGGFGIAITRAIADEVVYNEKQNEVVFIKYITPETAPGMPDPIRQA